MLNIWFRADTKHRSASLINKTRYLHPLKGIWTHPDHYLVAEFQQTENIWKKKIWVNWKREAVDWGEQREAFLRLQNLVPLVKPSLPKTTQNVAQGRGLSLFSPFSYSLSGVCASQLWKIKGHRSKTKCRRRVITPKRTVNFWSDWLSLIQHTYGCVCLFL